MPVRKIDSPTAGPVQAIAGLRFGKPLASEAAALRRHIEAGPRSAGRDRRKQPDGG